MNNTLRVGETKENRVPFKKVCSLSGHFTTPLNSFYLNGDILKSQKLLAKLTFKEYFKLPTKSYIKYPFSTILPVALSPIHNNIVRVHCFGISKVFDAEQPVLSYS